MIPASVDQPAFLADLGAADLLRGLALAGEDGARQQRYAELLGFVHSPRPPQQPAGLQANLKTDTPSAGDAAPAGQALRLPTRYQVRLFGLLAPVETEERPAPPELPHSLTGLADKDCAPRLPLAPIQLLPLVPPGRLWPALKKLIQTPCLGALDLPALTCQLARGRQPAVLPRRPVLRAVDQVMVVLDDARHLRPLAPDMGLVAAELRHLASHGGFSGYRVAGHPERVEESWGEGRPAADGNLPVPRGARVILVSDLGLARRQHSGATLLAWLNWLAALSRAGSQVRIVSPVAAATAQLPQVHTLAGGRLHVLRLRGGQPPLTAALERLKCSLACAVQVEPELLRAMRLADPALAVYPELESLYLQDEDVSRARSPVLTPDAAARLRPGLADWPVAAQRRVLQVLRHYHAGDYQAVEVIEILLWAAHASEAARMAEAEAIGYAQDWYARFEQDREAAPTSPAVRAFGNSVWGMVCRDGAMQSRYSRWLTPLWALDEDRRQAPPPPDLDADDLRAVLGAAPAQFACHLVQAGDWLVAQPEPAQARQSPVAGPFLTSRLGFRQDGPEVEMDYSGQPLNLARLSAGSIELQLDRQTLRIGKLDVPWWALEAGRDGDGAYVVAPVFSGSPWRYELPFPAAEGRFLVETNFAMGKNQEIGWTEQVDEFGPYVDLSLGPLTQRLRWIPPGDFLMGSPQDEPESFDDEHPQHRVILPEGCWLADTACTQALWQMVMGNNPSHFQDDSENPVEQVTWDDVQGFLEKLSQLAGVKAELPSEAEWEYACRAGTVTPFWWGDKLSVDDANYDGNYPYNGGAKGEWRQRTLPVKSFHPNSWGLWQMHGNVYEWCRDGLRDYGEAVLVAPEGPPGEGRALRGGSWFSNGGYLRAASRIALASGGRSRDIGFRFLLRSPGPGARSAGS